jgi:anti-anti-sigma factor
VGELDLAVAHQVAEAVGAELKDPPAALVLDLGPATFLDSSGARQLALVVREAQDAGVPVAVVCPSTNRPVRRTLALLGMEALVPLHETTDDLD